MSTVDDRIVNMQFNNRQFITGATESQKALQGLEQTIANTAKGGGLETMGSSVDQVTSRFGAMRIAGISAIATIASKATSAGLNLLKGMTLDPLMAGFQEYETNLKSVQTVMANTGVEIGKVNRYMDELNEYSDKTIYNFSQMAANIGRFTAAGVELPAATDAIKGMANAAALTGADTNQLNSAMYQMSQALSAGTIKLMDWNSLVNANMGTENIQESLKATARTMEDGGAAMDEAVTQAGNFRDSLQAGWLTADIFTKSMRVMAGTTNEAGDTVAFTVKQLKEMGYSTEAAKELNRLSGAAIDSATKIKTFTQLIDVVKESIGSGWAQVFENLFGNLNEAKELWTGVGETITGAIGGVFDGINEMLVGWEKAGGYAAMWSGFGNIFQAIGNILRPFVVAFQTLFPTTGKAGEGMANLSKGFESVTGWIEVATRGFDILTPVLVGVAEAIKFVFGQMGALLNFGGKVASIFGDLVQQGREIAEGILSGIFEGFSGTELMQAVTDLAHNIVDWIKNALGIHSPAAELIPVGEAIVMGIAEGIAGSAKFVWSSMQKLASKFGPMLLDGIVSVAGDVARGAQAIANAVIDVVKDFAPEISEAASATMDAVGTGLSAAGQNAQENWGHVSALFSAIGDKIADVFSALGSAAGWVAGQFGDLFGGLDALEWAGLMNALFTGATILIIRDFAKTFRDSISGIGEAVQGTFGQLTGTLKTMQNEVRAEMIRNIAIAVGILTLSLIALSFIEPKKLAISLGALAVSLGLLAATLAILSKIDGSFKLMAMGAALVLISIAMVNLAAAVTIFAQQDPAKVAIGIGMMAASLGVLMAAMFGFSAMKGSIEGFAGSILVLSIAMTALAAAVLAFGSMDMATLQQGLAGMAIGLGMLVAAMLALDAIKGSIEGMSASLLIMALALNVLVTAVLAFGSMDMATLQQGLMGMAVALGMMVLALNALAANQAGVMMAAGAMVLMAASLNMLVTVILTLGVAPWDVVRQGLTAVAIALGILLLAGAAAMVVGPGLITLGLAVGMLGAAMALAGVGMLAFGTGFAIMVAAGTAGVAIIVAAIRAFMAMLPSIAIQVGAAFVAFLQVLANMSPKIRAAMGTILKNMIGTVRDAIPEFTALLNDLINAGLSVLNNAVPKMIELGFRIIDSFIESAADHVPKMAENGIKLVTETLEAISRGLPRMADAAAKMVVKFVQSTADAINNNAEAMGDAGLDLAMALVNGVTGGLLSRGYDMVADAASQLANALPGWMKKVLGISSPSKVTFEIGRNVAEGLARGIVDHTKTAVAAAIRMANAVIAAGNKKVAEAQQRASQIQTAANRADARADIMERRAEARRKRATQFARTHPKAKAAIRRQEREAKRLERQAARQRSKANQAQSAADRAAQKVVDVRTFEEADLVGKGDIKQTQAVSLAEQASRMLARANAEAAEARRLMRTNKRAGRRMLEDARKDARRAKELAAAAQKANQVANDYYEQEVETRVKQLEDEAAFEAADTAGRVAILQARAAANEAKADAARESAAALIAEAKAVAEANAAEALRLVEQAEAAAQEAEDAAAQAKQERDQAAQLLNPGGGVGGSGGSIEPSRSVLEDAASAVDRYTDSLRQASELAAAEQSVIQFVQNNTSPEALTASEIYRQSKNLLSAAEVKMGANSVTTP